MTSEYFSMFLLSIKTFSYGAIMKIMKSGNVMLIKYFYLKHNQIVNIRIFLILTIIL